MSFLHTAARRNPRALQNPSKSRENIALLLGLLSSTTLAAAALAPFSDPTLASRAQLAEIGSRIADGANAEWDLLRRAREPLAEPCSPEFTWGPAIVPFAARRELERDASGSVARALVVEADRAEFTRHDANEALELALEALTKSPSERVRAEARLRAVQLAAKLERPDVVREQVFAAASELRGDEARDGVPCLAAIALAGADALAPADRTAIGSTLARAIGAGTLALPGDPAHLARATTAPFARTWIDDPQRAAWRARLRVIAGDAPVDAADRSERAAALREALGSLPDRPSDADWRARAIGDELFLWRASEATDCIGLYTPRASVEQRLNSVLVERELLSDGFVLDFRGDDASAGRIVRPRTELGDGVLSFVVRHPDPESFTRSTGRRIAWMRGGLLAMAAFALVAALTTFRALRRERRLAELKSTFVANVSHELRTPLASILLMAENLASGRAGGSEGEARYHGSIRREALRLRRLVDDVLDFSRLERGQRFELRVEDVDVASWIEELRGDLATNAASARAHVEFDIGAIDARAAFDPEALRRAVLNLVDNAWKHGGDGEVRVRIASDERALVISVSDRGPGIPCDRREHVFEPFARLDAAPTRTAGAGLGLAIVREIVRAHGGDVVIEDGDEGRGARFVITIPKWEGKA